MSDPTGNWIWYELMTSDPDAASRFYASVVGWTFSGDPDPQAGAVDYRHITRSDGGGAGGMLALTKDMTDHGARPCWVGYIHVADVDGAAAAIVADGGKLLMPKMTIPVGSFAMVADPQGAPFYVMTPTPPQPGAVSDVFSQTEPQHVRWNELAAADPVAALGFYLERFGWKQAGEMDMGPMGKYRFLQAGEVGIGAVTAKPPQSPTMWIHYIGVDDIDRAVAAVSAGGGKTMQGPHEIPGGEFSFLGIDPQGALFGLVGPRKA
jgi:predicted enzyme related to lactoylglutathione lyase